MKMTYLASAKINLNLHITDRLDNGFHMLDSLVYFTRIIGDHISIQGDEQHDTPLLSISGAFSNGLTTNDNLICRAAQLFQEYYDISHTPALHLVKNLPIASGIGGGSSDAAAAIHLLTDYFSKNITDDFIQKLCHLGADIPVCLFQKNCHMSGIGEKITAIDMPRIYLVLVNPLKTVATPEIFGQYRTSDMSFSKAQVLGPMDHLPAFIDQLSHSHNDLQPPAIALLPDIQDILQHIDKTQGCQLSRMSGSGATCFGIYKTKNDAGNAKNSLQKTLPHHWIQADI